MDRTSLFFSRSKTKFSLETVSLATFFSKFFPKRLSARTGAQLYNAPGYKKHSNRFALCEQGGIDTLVFSRLGLTTFYNLLKLKNEKMPMNELYLPIFLITKRTIK